MCGSEAKGRQRGIACADCGLWRGPANLSVVILGRGPPLTGLWGRNCYDSSECVASPSALRDRGGPLGKVTERENLSPKHLSPI
ncbi:hypothetical protein QE408_004046 [Agrobacterium larrymoorei]|uniref:Uncharacterized protein n=1 Tax=Agrobacterium larrymoorei TaxID=160699 RepID=A0ABU0UQ74_9HYPH|nr:hypothetical protein [Agrobacterium larrymoorei]